MKKTLLYLDALTTLLERKEFYWYQHILCLRSGDLDAAEKWEKKWDRTSKAILALIKQFEKELPHD